MCAAVRLLARVTVLEGKVASLSSAGAQVMTVASGGERKGSDDDDGTADVSVAAGASADSAAATSAQAGGATKQAASQGATSTAMVKAGDVVTKGQLEVQEQLVRSNALAIVQLQASVKKAHSAALGMAKGGGAGLVTSSAHPADLVEMDTKVSRLEEVLRAEVAVRTRENRALSDAVAKVQRVSKESLVDTADQLEETIKEVHVR